MRFDFQLFAIWRFVSKKLKKFLVLPDKVRITGKGRSTERTPGRRPAADEAAEDRRADLRTGRLTDRKRSNLFQPPADRHVQTLGFRLFLSASSDLFSE